MILKHPNPLVEKLSLIPLSFTLDELRPYAQAAYMHWNEMLTKSQSDHDEVGYKMDYKDLALLRDLEYVALFLLGKVQDAEQKSYPLPGKNIVFKLHYSYVFLLHSKVIHAGRNHFMQLAIDKIDAGIKNSPHSALLRYWK